MATGCKSKTKSATKIVRKSTARRVGQRRANRQRRRAGSKIAATVPPSSSLLPPPSPPPPPQWWGVRSPRTLFGDVLAPVEFALCMAGIVSRAYRGVATDEAAAAKAVASTNTEVRLFFFREHAVDWAMSPLRAAIRNAARAPLPPGAPPPPPDAVVAFIPLRRRGPAVYLPLPALTSMASLYALLGIGAYRAEVFPTERAAHLWCNHYGRV